MPGPGTPRRLPPDARRAQLLDAARTTLSRTGTGDFTLAAVAERAGVSGPLLRHYFGTREGLLVSVCRQLIGEALGILLAGMEGGGLEPRLAAYLDHIATQPWEHAIWMHASEVDPELEALVRDARTRLAAFSFALDWEDAPPARRSAAIGWVGYVESVVAGWVEHGPTDPAEPLGVLLEAARSLGVRDLP